MKLLGSLTLCVAMLAVPCTSGATDPARSGVGATSRAGDGRRTEAKEPTRPSPDPKPTEPPVVVAPTPGKPVTANLSSEATQMPLLALRLSAWDTVRSLLHLRHD